MPLKFAKWVAGLSGAVSAPFSFAPATLRVQFLVLVALIIVDTISGLWGAGFAPCADERIASHTLSSKLAAKIKLYAIILTLAGASAAICETWWLLSSGVLALIGCESLSLIENAVKLETYAGVNLGPLRPFLRHISPLLAIPRENTPSALGTENAPTVPAPSCDTSVSPCGEKETK